MKNFNKKYQKIVEEVGAVADVGNTTSTAFGPSQGHPAQIAKSGDFYEPGNSLNLFGTKVSGKKKKTKFKPPGFKKGKIIRRTLPGM